MPTLRIDKELKSKCYFLTFTIIGWINVFTSVKYFNVIINSLKFYQKHINLKIYGYVIMKNHFHLIAQCKDMIYFVKNFKSYTTHKIKQSIIDDKKLYILTLIKKSNNNSNKFHIWIPSNWPELVESEDFFNQKLNYIHENPIVKEYVEKEEDWLYSSSRNYILDDHSLIRVDTDGVLD